MNLIKKNLDKFGEDKTPVLLALELSQIKMEPKEIIKYFNQRFLTLKNKILVASQPPEDIIIENYTSSLPKYSGMFVKRAGKTMLVETFEEAIKVEKDSMSYEPDRSGKSDSFPHRKAEKPNSDKDKAFDIEQLQNDNRTLTNEVIGLKKTNSEASPSRGYFRNQFRQNPNTNNKNTPPDIAANEEILNTIRVVLSLSEAPSS